jgi:hypothetical protein
MSDIWKKAQEFEIGWWGDFLNTYGEEEKQIVYATKMGLRWFHNGKSPYNIDLGGAHILDIGGAASSLLLKCLNRGECIVIDPIPISQWAKDRYSSGKIDFLPYQGERDVQWGNAFDEVWIYNVLQHTEDPAKICANARKWGKIVRVFEWIDTHTNDGHPHELTEKNLNEWLGGQGKTDVLKQHTLRGKCYYGVFKGDNYVA